MPRSAWEPSSRDASGRRSSSSPTASWRATPEVAPAAGVAAVRPPRARPAARAPRPAGGARRLPRLAQVHELHAGGVRKLVVGRVAAELGLQLSLDGGDLALADADVRRDADRSGAVLDPALDGLADPERRVGGELVALAPVELLGRAH